MAKEIDRWFVVKVQDACRDMVAESSAKYQTYGAAKAVAGAVARNGTYAEVREVVVSERCKERFEP